MSPLAADRALRLLVVDDRRDAALMLKTLLAHAGHDVVTATDGATAVEVARSLSPHAIISDLSLAGPLDGCELAQAVLADPSIPKPWLIAVTGYDDDDHRDRAKAAGFQYYLVKPPEFATLMAILSTIDVAQHPSQ